MIYTIQNETLTLEVNEIGAELWSISAPEYPLGCLWDGNPAGWARRAPVCFPWCGRMEEGYFTESGRRYEAGIHGFIRDLPHTLVAQTPDSLRFRLEVKADETAWPWAFSLETEHRLEGERVISTCTAENRSGSPMPTQFGFHAGLRCPFSEGESPTEYRFRFEAPEAPDGGHVLPITTHLFDDDSICFEGLKSRWIQVENGRTGQFLRIDTQGFPYVLLWSQIDLPGFVCIEPWTGYPGTGHDLRTRPGSISLQPGEKLTRTQVLTTGSSI